MQGASATGSRLWLFLVLMAALAGAGPQAAQAQQAQAQQAQVQQAQAQQKVALVIGNSAYQDAPLKNPVNDARAVARKLGALGFEVTTVVDASRRQMQEAMIAFSQRLRPGATSLFYFAGHGIQARGRNYLVPVDARLGSEAALKFEAIDVRAVLEEMELARSRVNLVVLDACRNNPFEQRFRGGGRGLAAIDAARGTLIAYATGPGTVAADGDGSNGVYTAALLETLSVPGLKAEEVFKRVRIAVTQRTGGRQVPWESSSLTGDFVFNQAAVTAPSAATVADGDGGNKADMLFWESIKDSGDPALFNAYLQKFPNGTFASIAKVRANSGARDASRPPDAATAGLVVRSNVSRDTVVIDGTAYGPTGPARIELAAGSHELRVEKPGYEPYVTQLDLGPGETRTVRVRLARSAALAASGQAVSAAVNTASAAAQQAQVAPAAAAPPPGSAAPKPAPVGTGKSAASGGTVMALARMLLRKKEPRSDADLLEVARKAMDDFARDAQRIAADPSLDLSGRSDEFRGLLRYVVDIKAMGKMVLGTHRKQMNIDQWDTFIALYEKFLLGGNYSFSKAKTWKGRIHLDGLRRQKRDFIATFLVGSESASKLKLEFRIRKSTSSGLKYKVVDVRAGGVSLVVTQRREFHSILARDGIDGLNGVLENKISQRG